MNGHFKDAELVDWLEGVLPPERHTHLDRCAACRSRAEMVRATLEDLRRSELSVGAEPSPLFWEHFSRRVHDAIADQPVRQRSNWIGSSAPMAAALVLLVGLALMWSQHQSHGPAPAVSESGLAQVVAPDPDPVDLEGDVEWGLVRLAADDLEWDAAADAGLQATPGSAERVAVEMSTVERHELERLIAAEMKQIGA